MSGNESVAEEVYEAGIELVNPGGRPDILKDAAKGWRQLAEDVEGLFKALDAEVNNTVGETWRGPAAEAFQQHFRELKKTIDEVTPDFEKAADGLDEAAENIAKVNEEITEIYLEIGISIGVSVAMSFVTVGFSAAAGAARAAQLAARAIQAAGRLGQALQRIAQIFRAIYTSQRFMGAGKLALDGLANWAGGTAGGVATSLLSGKGPELGTNMVGGFTGATLGTAVGTGVGAVMKPGVVSDFASGAAGGAVGGFSGDYLDSVRKGEDFDPKAASVSAITGGGAGGAGGVSVGMRSAFTPHQTDAQALRADVATNSVVPIPGGVIANDSKDSLNPEEPDGDEGKAEQRTAREAKADAKGLDSSGVDKIKEDFG